MIATLRDRVFGRRGSPVEAEKPKRFDPSIIDDGFSDKESAVATVRKMWDRGRTRMYPKMQQWLANVLFFRGDQFLLPPNAFLEDHPYEYALDEADLANVDVRANLVMKHCLAWVARVTQNSPRTRVYPVTDDEDDKDRATVHNRLIEWRGRVIRFPKLLMECALYASVYSCGFLKAYYDPEAGDYVHPLTDLGAGDMALLQDPEFVGAFPELEPLAGMAGQMMSLDDMSPEGDVLGKALPPYHFTVPDPYCTKLDDCRLIIESQIETMQMVKEAHYDHPDVEYVRPGDDVWAHQLWFMQSNNSDAISALAGDDSEEDDNHSTNGRGRAGEDAYRPVLVHRVYGLPTRKRPRGIYMQIAGGVLLEPRKMKEMENPFWHQSLPYVQIRHTNDTTTFWGTNDLEQAIPVQEQVNRTLSQVIEIRDRCSNPQILDNGSGVDWDNVKNVPGEVLRNANPNRKPEYMNAPNVPVALQSIVEQLRSALEEIFSDHEPSRGVGKAGDSGAKVRALQQADEARFAPFARETEDAINRFWMQQLCLIAQHIDRRKQGYVVGQQNERSYFSYDRSDVLNGVMQPESVLFTEEDADRARVLALKQMLDIETEVVPGKSVATVREELSMLGAMGVIRPGEHDSLVLQMLGYNLQAQDLMESRRQQASHAAMENDAFMAGQPPHVPMIREDHQQHIETHIRLVRTRTFEALPPEAQQVMFQHIEAHEMAIIQEPLRVQLLQQRVMTQLMAQYPQEAMALAMSPMGAGPQQQTGGKPAGGAQPGGAQQGGPQQPQGPRS